MKTAVQFTRVSLLALASGLFLAGCGQNEVPESAQQGSQEPPPHPVEVVELTRQDVSIERSYPSLLRSDDEVTDAATVEEIGHSLALFPAVALAAVGEALDHSLRALKSQPRLDANGPKVDRIGAGEYLK